MKIRIICLMASWAIFVSTSALAIQPMVGDIKDTRTTAHFFAALELELKLVGDDLASYSSVRASVERATDDTGRNLLPETSKDVVFKELSKFGSRNPTVKLELANPARKAGVISEVAGKLEFYSPTADPKSVIKIPNILSHSSKPIEIPELIAAGIEFTVYSDSDYRKEREESQKKALEDAKAKGLLADMPIRTMFGGFGGGDNSLTFKIKDANSKLIHFRLLDSSSVEIQSNSSATVGEIKALHFPNKIPEDAGLEIQLLTPKSLTVVPLNLTNIPLP